MKVLFIGGTGLISTAVSKKVIDLGMELYVLNRGNKNHLLPEGAHSIIGDIYNEQETINTLKDYEFDCVVNWIAFTKEDCMRDYRIFKGITKQYIFISSASAYKKPVTDFPITEETPLDNPYWEYSRNKQYCEEYLQSINDPAFNVTIVRPSHTYDDTKIILCMKQYGSEYMTIDRLLKGKPIIIPGDGTSLWTITHNTDFANGFVGLIGNKDTYNEVYHLTGDKVYTWDQLLYILADHLNVTPNIIHIPTDDILKHFPHMEGELKGDKINSCVFDNSKIKAVSQHYTSEVKYEDVVSKAIKYYQSQPELMVYDKEFEEKYDQLIEQYQNK